MLAIAEPVFARLGDALGDGGALTLVGGNHDHGIVAPWLIARGRRTTPAPLALDETPPKSASELSGRLAKAAGPAELTLAYPGLWLREDVYAFHGHYLDRLTTLPSFERLVLGAMARVVGPVPARNATPDDFEAAQAPMFALAQSVVEHVGGRWALSGNDASTSTWSTLSGTRRARRSPRALALAAAFPVAIAGVNALGLGPVRAQLSGPELRRASLRAISDVVLRLGIGAEHVIFGHTHRAGPLPGDRAHEWQAATGPRLHNPGCWVRENAFIGDADEMSPYYAGRAIELRDGAPPRVVRVTRDLG